MRFRWSWLALAIGYLFLYLPLICVVVYSFNESRFVNVWTGFSFIWYKKLLSDHILIRATLTSLKVAAIAASVSVILGTISAIILTRFHKMPGKLFFSGAITAPLVMPEVVIGLSLLMLFIGMNKIIGWPSGHGSTTVIIAHITLTLAYVTMMVQARLHDVDKSIEEAALDLGASPLKVFFVITLPLISPAIILGWLLAFALSLDDVVIASFVAGPGSTTLPMIVFSSLRFGISPEINALASILMLVLTIGVLTASIFIYKRNANKHI